MTTARLPSLRHPVACGSVSSLQPLASSHSASCKVQAVCVLFGANLAHLQCGPKGTTNFKVSVVPRSKAIPLSTTGPDPTVHNLFRLFGKMLLLWTVGSTWKRKWLACLLAWSQHVWLLLVGMHQGYSLVEQPNVWRSRNPRPNAKSSTSRQKCSKALYRILGWGCENSRRKGTEFRTHCHTNGSSCWFDWRLYDLCVLTSFEDIMA